MVSVPIPHPTSSTRLPRQRGNSAKRGMWGSTKYLRASTSSKYSRSPTGLGECRMLQGRSFQYCWTVRIGTSWNCRLMPRIVASGSPNRLALGQHRLELSPHLAAIVGLDVPVDGPAHALLEWHLGRPVQQILGQPVAGHP